MAFVLPDPVVGFCSQEAPYLKPVKDLFIHIIGMLSVMVCLLLFLWQADDYDVLREGALV